jgi:hypothetical protein
LYVQIQLSVMAVFCKTNYHAQLLDKQKHRTHDMVWDRCTWYECTKTDKEKNMKPYALGLDETKTRCRITETRKKREKSLFLKLWCLALFAQVWTNLRSQYVVGATCRYFQGWGCRRELKISPFDKTHIFFWMWQVKWIHLAISLKLWLCFCGFLKLFF